MSLDQQTAIRRAQLIRPGSISYNYNIILETTLYHGLAEIAFYLQTKAKDDLVLDFSGDQVEVLIVNDLAVDHHDDERDNFIILPKAFLQKGKNRVSVMYHCQFNKDLSGLISFEDNGEQFLYTDFEPYGANRVFPCFDQPNLKGYMNLTVIGPEAWRVLSHEHPITNESFRAAKYVKNSKWGHSESKHLLDAFSKKVINPQNTKLTVFPQTKILPSYIFCFCAGNYQQIPTNEGKKPMSLFCIPAAYQKLKSYSKLIFDVTIKCMDFYERKFGLQFPFNKYDQIFIREFGAFAMQNAGIVTFSETRMLPQNPTQYDKYITSLVISHELSHHWFGDYVTMVWWDDLWLNQSFAEWMSCYSLESLKDYFGFESYLYFRDGKNSGYEDDQRNNATHPIRGTVANTDEAFSIFDGITYQKGASALKQLTFLVDDTPDHTKFFKAIQSYFRRFPWGNATIDDLLDDIATQFPASAGSLDDWKHKWLEVPSLNVFDVDWDQTNSQITLKQTSFNATPVIRTHKLKIALFESDGKITNIDAFINSDSAVIPYTGGPYSAVLVNNEDWTFAENNIDPISFQFFRNNIHIIDDLFTRLMIWYNFRSMVNLSRVTMTEYVAFIKENLFIEPSPFILEKILGNLHFFLSDFVEQALGNTYRSSICQLIYQQLQTADDTQTQKIKILQDNYIKYSHTQDEIRALWSWLNNADANLQKRLMNQDQKWKTVVKIFTLDLDPALKWNVFYQVRDQDSSALRIQEYNTIVTVLAANQQQFQAIYQQFKKSDVSLSVKYLQAEGWNNEYHYDWIASYLDRYFKDIVEVSQTLSYQEFQFFYTALKPLDRDLQKQVTKYNEVITELEALGEMDEHIRNIRKFIDDINLRIQNITFNDTNLALSQARAIQRYNYIKAQSISYIFHLAFVKEEQYYQGMAEISFELTKIPSVLPLDCVCDTIYTINANSFQLNPISDGQFLFIPQRYLKLGKNTLTIHYRNKFNNDGLGCMSYIQTVKDRYQYIYTKFQPYGAHRFVPCFDQPDFRARAQFIIIVPSGWMAVGNQKVQYKGDFSAAAYKANVPTQNEALLDTYLANKAGYFYEFTLTPKISTYLYCIAVGEYYQKVVDASKLYRENIPMSLYCIKSYSDRLDGMEDFIVEMTTLSLALFQKLFATPYKFSKYDTIFCHEFKAGAMENPGLITFRDTYLYPEKVSLQKMLALASTIIHENSHNWFGNYVTMKWWDDLWLNESFADFIAHYALEQLKDKVTTIDKYDSGWKIFLVRGVPGYREDQITQTTHAVRSVVENTSVASTYFDRITYQKGSATLKQLMFLMGETEFFQGVQDYFKEFGWQNATIDNFLNKMQTYFKKDIGFTLDEWKTSWLLTPSLNTVSITWDPTDLTDNAILTINQEYYSDVYPTLRYHKTRVAFFYDDCTYDVQDILLRPEATFKLPYKGTKNYKAILVNYEYWSYFKYTIDKASLEFFKQNLNKITNQPSDVLTRMIIWHDINEQVRDAKYKVADYITTLNKFIFDQKDDKIFQFEFSFVRDVLNTYIPIEQRPALKTQLFEAIYNNLKSWQGDINNRVILLKDQLTVFVTQASQVQLLEDWRNQINNDLSSFPITVSQAWEVVKLQFAIMDYPPGVKNQTYEDQYFKTPGIQGQLTRNTCDALIADATKFEEIYTSFKKMELSLDAKESFASGWNNLTHLDALQGYYKSDYFLNIPLLSVALLSNHFQFFYINLKPIDDDLLGTIASYEKIKLQGSQMIGHIKVLTQIKYGYQLRKKIYDFNQG